MSEEIIPLHENDLKVLDTVNEVVGKAVMSGNPLVATEFVNELRKDVQVKGLALAKLLWAVQENWHVFERAGIADDFVTFMNVQTGVSRQTIVKYARMWKNIFANPDIEQKFKDELMGKDIKSLLLLTALASEGIEQETMEKIVQATDTEAVREVVREERGEATSSKTALRIYYQMRDGDQFPPGTLFIRSGNGKPTIIGTLAHGSGDEDVEKAINRILNATHITEVV